MTLSGPEIFTATSAYSLGGVAAMAAIATIGAKVLLPKNARWQDSFTFIWLVCGFFISFNHNRHHRQAFDALIHFSFEGSFLYLSTFGGTVNSNVGPFAELCE